MALDQHANFAYTTVATAPSPASSGLSLVVAAGTGSLFPTPPFNVTAWPTGVNPLATNAEILRVTAVATDTFTLLRAQEGTVARSILVGDQLAVTITAKTFTDAETLTPAYFRDEPCVIASGDVFAAASGSLLWTDSAVFGVYDLAFSVLEPAVSVVFWPGSTTKVEDDPFILDSGLLGDLGGNAATVLWTDAARCPTTISTLLVIGI